MLEWEVLAAAFSSQGLVWAGNVPLSYERDFLFYREWLSEKRHGSLSYLENHLELRQSPTKLLPGAQQAILFFFPYYPGERFRDLHSPLAGPKIASYAKFSDYHRRMKALACQAISNWAAKCHQARNYRYRILVDSAPILERALFSKLSRGFIGKNTMYIDGQYGSFVLLGEVLTDFPLSETTETLATKPPLELRCGSCVSCQTHCPTGALNRDYSIDANRCLSYWTIEHRGTIPIEFWPSMKLYWFGCDICQIVCPHNIRVPVASLAGVKSTLLEIPLLSVVKMTEREYSEWFGGTPLTRAKREGLQRNALIAMVVTEDKDLAIAIDHANEQGGNILKETLHQIPSFHRFLTEKKMG